MIKYKVGDVTSPTEKNIVIIVHCCNDIGVMGGGVALALRNKWPVVFEKYEEWYADDHYQDADSLPHRAQQHPFVLGQIQFVKVDTLRWVCNLIGQRDVQSYYGMPPVRYEAIREGLRRLAMKLSRDNTASKKYLAANYDVVMPRMGSDRAGGEWMIVEKIVQEELADFSVTIYDLEPQPNTLYEPLPQDIVWEKG